MHVREICVRFVAGLWSGCHIQANISYQLANGGDNCTILGSKMTSAILTVTDNVIDMLPIKSILALSHLSLIRTRLRY